MRAVLSASLLAMAALASAAAPAAGTTYQVGPTRSFTTIGQVQNLLNPGDVVEVDGNATYPAVTLTRPGTAAQPITIRGLRVNGNRPIVSGGTNTVQFELSTHTVLEGFEITGGSSRCVFVHAGHITIRDTLVRNCPAHGILGADEDAGWLTLEYVEVRNAGNGTNQHPIYVSSDPDVYPGATFRISHSYVHDGNGGNAIKSRAERNEIYYNWIENGFFRELELIGRDADFAPGPRPMHSDIVGNVLIKGPGRASPVVRVGHDDTDNNGSRGRYRFVNNTFITDQAFGTAIQAFGRLDTIEAHNNVFFRRGGTNGQSEVIRVVNEDDAMWEAGHRVSSGSKNWIMTDAGRIPSEWTGTISGADPGFTNLAAKDVRPGAGSPLINAGGTSAPASPAGFPFPSPLYPPAFQPPLHVAATTATPRPVNGTIDIGPYESGAAPGCTYSIAPTSDSFAAGGGTDSVSVNAGAGCAWTAASNVPWATITSGASGSGIGTVSYSVAANTGAARSGTLTIAGQAFSLTQAGAGGSGFQVDLYVDQPTGAVTFTGGSGAAQAAIVAEGVGGSNAIKHTGLAMWDGTKRLHFATPVDISGVLPTDKLQISLDISSGAPQPCNIYLFFNDNWQLVVNTTALDSTPGYQTFTIDISSIRASLGSGVNDIYFKAGNGFPSNGTLWVDNFRFVRP